MGLHIYEKIFLDAFFRELQISPEQAKIVEFGNGVMRKDLKKSCGKHTYVKGYYESLGATYVSFDTNGKGGALKRDLRLPILDKKYVGKFDMLLNLGTAEHVSYQYGVWRNAHQLVRVGGGFFHIGPEFGRKKDHGVGLYYKAFFTELSELCGYRVARLRSYSPPKYVDTRCKDPKFAINMLCALVKETDIPFPSINVFYTMCDRYFHSMPMHRKELALWREKGAEAW